jgi:type I restriction enzyme M protein
VIGINAQNSVAATTAYDPTCGSGSLLLKVAAEAGKRITLEGQEMDVTTSGLARMNMILHDFPTANIMAGNTLANPKFLDGTNLRTYDYVVANPPFSDKTWSTGITPSSDLYRRFEWGEPPAKQGDYAYLLHIIRSMKSTGKAACILPHGVLFRGNAEAGIRRNLINSGILKGVIGLPANLFYGTGIPACILVLDKENAQARKGIFMVDASKGFMKDGNKNRLREQDIHKIVDTFMKQEPIDKFSRMVPLDEIADTKNDYNLNIPRYIDSTEQEDIQDIDAHLNGGIPNRDIDNMSAYWEVLPGLRNTLFKNGRKGYLEAKLIATEIKPAIHQNAEFETLKTENTKIYEAWKKKAVPQLNAFGKDAHPKALIGELSESLLNAFKKAKLIDAYDVYQHLMNYWNETMQDDAYLIAADGWKAETRRVVEEVKAGKDKGKKKDKGWACDLIPKELLVSIYFQKEKTALDTLQAELENAQALLTELEEENSGEDGVFSALDKINKGEINKRLKEIKGDKEAKEEAELLNQWIVLDAKQAELKANIKKQEEALDKKAYEKYPLLTETKVQSILIEHKWLPAIEVTVKTEMDRISQQLTGRVKELIERYDTPLPSLDKEVKSLEDKVNAHLKKMGFVWQ